MRPDIDEAVTAAGGYGASLRRLLRCPQRPAGQARAPAVFSDHRRRRGRPVMDPSRTMPAAATVLRARNAREPASTTSSDDETRSRARSGSPCGELRLAPSHRVAFLPGSRGFIGGADGMTMMSEARGGLKREGKTRARMDAALTPVGDRASRRPTRRPPARRMDPTPAPR